MAHGGLTDTAAEHAVATYQVANVPAVLISHSDGGHTAWWDDPTDGSPPPSDRQLVPGPIAAHWMAFTLYGKASAGQYFLGPQCGLCTRPGWQVESRNWAAHAS